MRVDRERGSRAAVERCAADLVDNHQKLGLEVNMYEPVPVTQGSALPAVAARQAAHADAGQCRNR